jgi:hypothetical protein
MSRKKSYESYKQRAARLRQEKIRKATEGESYRRFVSRLVSKLAKLDRDVDMIARYTHLMDDGTRKIIKDKIEPSIKEWNKLIEGAGAVSTAMRDITPAIRMLERPTDEPDFEH